MQTEANPIPADNPIKIGNDALIAECVKNVFIGATRISQRWLKPGGYVNVYRSGREIHVLVNWTYSHSTGKVQKDGTILWDDQHPQATNARCRLGR